MANEGWARIRYMADELALMLGMPEGVHIVDAKHVPGEGGPMIDVVVRGVGVPEEPGYETAYFHPPTSRWEWGFPTEI